MRLYCGYSPLFFRSLQQTTCSCTARRDVRRGPRQIGNCSVVPSSSFVAHPSFLLSSFISFSILQYIFRLLLFIFPDAEHTLLHHYHSPSSAHSGLVPPRIIRRTRATSGHHPPHFWFRLLHFTHSISLIPHPLPSRVHTSQCRLFPLTRQDVRKRRRITIRIRTYIFLETFLRL